MLIISNGKSIWWLVRQSSNWSQIIFATLMPNLSPSLKFKLLGTLSHAASQWSAGPGWQMPMDSNLQASTSWILYLHRSLTQTHPSCAPKLGAPWGQRWNAKLQMLTYNWPKAISRKIPMSSSPKFTIFLMFGQGEKEHVGREFFPKDSL